MFVYHYRRFYAPRLERGDSLAELFQSAWANMEYETGYPDRIARADGEALIDQAKLLEIAWYGVPDHDDRDGRAAYFEQMAAQYTPQ